MKKRRSIICVIIALFLVISLVSCSLQQSKETKKDTETETSKQTLNTIESFRKPISTEYSLEIKDDGYYYITFDDFEYYWHHYCNRSNLGPFEATSISEFKNNIEYGLLSENDKESIISFYFYSPNKETNETKEIKLYDFNNFCIPTLPSNVYQYSLQMYSSDHYIHVLIWGEDTIFEEDGSVTYKLGGHYVFGYLTFSGKDDYDSHYAECEAKEYSKHKVEEGAKTVEVFYNDYSLYLFISENDVYCYMEMPQYIEYNGGLPSDEWLLSFGVEKYVEPEAPDET